MGKTLRNLHQAMRRHNEKYPDDLKEQVRRSMKYTAEMIYLDFIKKFGKGCTREAKLRATYSYFAGGGCQKTVYNHVQRLIKAGIVKKSRAVMNFGKGAINCLELKLDETILEIEVTERFVETKPLVAFNLPKLHLSDEKRRVRQVVSFGDLVKSFTVKV